MCDRGPPEGITYMENLRISYVDTMIIGAFIGYLLGFITVIFGIIRRRILLGLIGLLASIVSGAILGPILSLPVISVFIWLIDKKPAVDAPGGNPAAPGDIAENS